MKKRILTLFVTFCLVLSMVVPSAFAADDSGALTYSFYDNTVTSGKTKLYNKENANKVEVSFTSDPAASYLNTSYSTGGVQLASSYFLAGFSKDRTVQDWCALKISDVVAGTYDMTFDLQNSTKAGVFTVFVVTENAYSTILNNGEKDYVSTLSAGGDLTQAQNKEILTALESAALNQVSEGKLDNGNLNDVPELQSIGKVTFPENGNYVIVFRCDGVSANCEKTGARLLLNSLTMTPIVATVGDKSFTDAGEAIAAIEAANEKTKVEITGKLQLSADLITAAAITVNKGAELDLNGKKLTADVIGQGKLTDSSAAAGVVISDEAPTCGVNADELLLKTTAGYQIFDYTMTAAEPVKAEDGKSVNFWFDVRFAEAQATAAYTAIAAGNSGFELTVDLSWENGSALPVRFGDGKSVADWASLMLQKPEYSFYICVQGLDSVTTAGTLKAAPKINGLQGSSTVEMAYDITVQ